MAEEAQTTNETPAEGADGSKEAIYLQVAAWVENKTGKKIGKTGGRVIFDLVVSEVMAAAVRDKVFRLNGGFGSFHLKDYGAGERRLPSGATTKFGERSKLRYEQGVVTGDLIGNGGDLKAALDARATERAARNADKPAAEAKADAKPAKTDAKSEATAAKAEEAPAEAGVEGEMELD